MSRQLAIRAKGLGKAYQLGGAEERNETFREMVMSSLAAPFRRLRRLGGEDVNAERFWALKDINFDIQAGEVVGIIGRNGAGKSTLLKILSRITDPSEGRVEIRGRVSSLLEVGTGFHPELTGRENIFLNGAVLGMTRFEIESKFDEIVAFAEIERFLDTPVKRYSSGMYVRLAFAVAAHLEPEILVVDEVLAVGDAAFQKKCLGKMGEVAKTGRTVLFVSHNMAAVRALCTRAILLQNGNVAADGDIESIIEQYMIQSLNEADQPHEMLPLHHKKYGLSLQSVDLKVDQDNDDVSMSLEVVIEAEGTIRNIGVGIEVTSLGGAKVCSLGPAVTNFTVDSITGRQHCKITCNHLQEYLSSGDYILDVWLAKPRSEYLIRLERAAVLTIPPLDHFASGMFVTEQKHGIVPLPLKFYSSKEL